jgi:uncharacterized protein (DUF302 family)
MLMSRASSVPSKPAAAGVRIPLVLPILVLALAGAAVAAVAVASKAPILAASGGLLAGLGVAGLGVVLAMPRLMILREESPLGFDETVASLEKGIVEHGWGHQGTTDMRDNLRKKGVDFPHPVKNVQLCHPSHARSVLTTDRHLACLMPCSISVWEADDGKVTISKMNTGLMGKLFGGNVARVMGGPVARDEASILATLHRGAVAASRGSATQQGAAV